MYLGNNNEDTNNYTLDNFGELKLSDHKNMSKADYEMSIKGDYGQGDRLVNSKKINYNVNK